ncbi:hypothetical protein ACQP3C_29210, partial [Escherichia coli]
MGQKRTESKKPRFCFNLQSESKLMDPAIIVVIWLLFNIEVWAFIFWWCYPTYSEKSKEKQKRDKKQVYP